MIEMMSSRLLAIRHGSAKNVHRKSPVSRSAYPICQAALVYTYLRIGQYSAPTMLSPHFPSPHQTFIFAMILNDPTPKAPFPALIVNYRDLARGYGFLGFFERYADICWVFGSRGLFWAVGCLRDSKGKGDGGEGRTMR